ncbi:MAG: 4-(cytidine 5'-diphospho)-2-C-methyl-D-erythritol kinase [Alphaproteobacteria bacterium]
MTDHRTTRPLKIFSPAKINLFLHITGKRSDGYHTLDSLVSFADIGDTIEIAPADSFSFQTNGPFARYFNDKELNPYSHSDNLVVKAANAASQATSKPLNMSITLTKNLPLAAGLGGGSANAAATLWGLLEFWGMARNADYLLPLMTQLGADVPVCFHSSPSIMRGIGDILEPAPDMPEVPILLINPLISCSTKDIFLRRSGEFSENSTLPTSFSSIFDLTETLKRHSNDLYEPALNVIPDIENVIYALSMQKNCLLTRMSGSGASCFGIFETIEDARKAKTAIQEENSDWWVEEGFLNSIERY